uniref:G-protein coupled receptors family 1 profile domain-containing protein n=1 Tax=Scleropages formosus TaxID=113540 RepID=A0A8C9VFG8_SCLFO
MDNMSVKSPLLRIQGFDIPENFVYPLFFLMLLVYVALVTSNTGVLLLIISEKSLQQPMYVLFCNLSVNDLLGNTVLIPRLMLDIISSERQISYNECVLQAFCSHTYVSILLGLTVRLSRCHSLIQNAYCDNAGLFKLSCEDVTINNIYGLFFTVVLFACSMGSICVTYLQIAVVCWNKKNKDLNTKALQTCASHLVLFLVMWATGFLTIILHRFPNYPDLRKVSYILFHVIPANLNPIIYAMQTKLLREKILQMFNRKVTNF